MEVLDWTAAALDRVDQPAFFARFHTGKGTGQDPAVPYFYESFLEAFDPELRKQLGVWYTPAEVVRYMVARVDRALKDDLDIPDGLAVENVYVAPPRPWRTGGGKVAARTSRADGRGSGIFDVAPGAWSDQAEHSQSDGEHESGQADCPSDSHELGAKVGLVRLRGESVREPVFEGGHVRLHVCPELGEVGLRVCPELGKIGGGGCTMLGEVGLRVCPELGEVGANLGKVGFRRQCIPVGSGGRADRPGDGFGLAALDAGRFEVAGGGAHGFVQCGSAVGVRSAG